MVWRWQSMEYIFYISMFSNFFYFLWDFAPWILDSFLCWKLSQILSGQLPRQAKPSSRIWLSPLHCLVFHLVERLLGMAKLPMQLSDSSLQKNQSKSDSGFKWLVRGIILLLCSYDMVEFSFLIWQHFRSDFWFGAVFVWFVIWHTPTSKILRKKRGMSVRPTAVWIFVQVVTPPSS